MNEEQEKQEMEQTKSGNDSGDKPTNNTLSVIDEANKAAKRLEQANKERAELLKKQEELEARQRLGGSVEVKPQEKPKEETPKEYIDRILKTGKI